uniref:Uncharacterized protein n=1 Tax=Rhizophora mucronata TaxID=61149 RepID=A0A2P2QQX5_RHIMU
MRRKPLLSSATTISSILLGHACAHMPMYVDIILGKTLKELETWIRSILPQFVIT